MLVIIKKTYLFFELRANSQSKLQYLYKKNKFTYKLLLNPPQTTEITLKISNKTPNNKKFHQLRKKPHLQKKT